MNKILKSIILIFFLAVVVLVSGCVQQGDINTTISADSQKIINQANDVIIANVGKENFENYYKFEKIDYINATYESRYVLFYSVYISNEKVYNFPIWIYTDGRIRLEGLPIPDCIENQQLCSFITKTQAMEIAQQNEFGFERDYVNIDWDPKASSYVWKLVTTPVQRGDCTFNKVMIINANSGEVLGIKDIGACA